MKILKEWKLSRLAICAPALLVAACVPALKEGQPIVLNPIVSPSGEQRGEYLQGFGGLPPIANFYGLADGRDLAVIKGETWDQQFYNVASPVAAVAGTGISAGLSNGTGTSVNVISSVTAKAGANANAAAKDTNINNNNNLNNNINKNGNTNVNGNTNTNGNGPTKIPGHGVPMSYNIRSIGITASLHIG